MAILGYNTKGAVASGGAAGLKLASPFVLASPQTLTELHGWFGAGSGSDHVILYMYTDSGGNPATRVAYTAPLALTGADVELSQTGFNVALAAGTYWIGWVFENNAGNFYREASGGSYKGTGGGATFNPPSDPFGTINSTNAVRVLSVWAVVGAAPAGPSFVPQIVAVT